VAMMVYVMVYVIMLYVVQSYQQFSLRDWLYGIIYLRFVIVLPSQKQVLIMPNVSILVNFSKLC